MDNTAQYRQINIITKEFNITSQMSLKNAISLKNLEQMENYHHKLNLIICVSRWHSLVYGCCVS
jgi:maleate cis-trans isomerase